MTVFLLPNQANKKTKKETQERILFLVSGGCYCCFLYCYSVVLLIISLSIHNNVKTFLLPVPTIPPSLPILPSLLMKDYSMNSLTSLEMGGMFWKENVNDCKSKDTRCAKRRERERKKEKICINFLPATYKEASRYMTCTLYYSHILVLLFTPLSYISC